MFCGVVNVGDSFVTYSEQYSHPVYSIEDGGVRDATNTCYVAKGHAGFPEQVPVDMPIVDNADGFLPAEQGCDGNPRDF